MFSWASPGLSGFYLDDGGIVGVEEQYSGSSEQEGFPLFGLTQTTDQRPAEFGDGGLNAVIQGAGGVFLRVVKVPGVGLHGKSRIQTNLADPDNPVALGRGLDDLIAGCLLA